jgi:hypothetical protein
VPIESGELALGMPIATACCAAAGAENRVRAAPSAEATSKLRFISLLLQMSGADDE